MATESSKSESKSSKPEVQDYGAGVSPEGVPYQAPGARGKEHELRERSAEDEAHDKAVADAQQVVKEAGQAAEPH